MLLSLFPYIAYINFENYSYTVILEILSQLPTPKNKKLGIFTK